MKTHLGSNLKFLRRMKNMTQTQLATDLNLKRNNIASYEAGIVEPQFKILLTIAQYFDTPVHALLTDILEKDVLDVFEEPAASNVDAVGYIGIENELETFIESTNNAQKSIDGFKEMYALSRQNSTEDSMKLSSLHADLDNLVDLTTKLVDINWEFIQALQRDASGSTET